MRFPRATVGALVEALIVERCPEAGSSPSAVRSVASFVLAEMGRLPRHLRPLVLLATLGLAAWALLRKGASLPSLGPSGRSTVLAEWRRSPVGPCRDLIRLYEGLAVYGWFSLPRATAPRPSAPAPGAR
jgi:hypothetical protein